MADVPGRFVDGLYTCQWHKNSYESHHVQTVDGARGSQNASAESNDAFSWPMGSSFATPHLGTVAPSKSWPLAFFFFFFFKMTMFNLYYVQGSMLSVPTRDCEAWPVGDFLLKGVCTLQTTYFSRNVHYGGQNKLLRGASTSTTTVTMVLSDHLPVGGEGAAEGKQPQTISLGESATVLTGRR